MFFWIFLILLSRQLGLTQGHPDLFARASTEASCDCTINSCRSLFDIVWGCLATIFACTWVALHQNVPDPDLGWFSLLLRKIKMMLVTIIAPEVIVTFAARQLVSALQFNVSKTHGFFCTMGGFVSKEGDPVSRDEEITVYMSAIQAVKEADILDKSKGDALSKGIALAQALWFVTQCVARAFQHLPITELEVATLAFAVISTFIRLLWWWKPLDVQQPIIVVRHNIELDLDPLEGRDNAVRTSTPNFATKLFDMIVNMIGGEHNKYSPLSSRDDNKLANFASFAGVFGVGTIFGDVDMENRLCVHRCISNPDHTPSICYTVLDTLDTNLYDTVITRLIAFSLIGIVPYTLCRLILIILSFTTLRQLPQSIFVDVNWSNYIPHL
ncbi:hypothetical protein B0H16DRAFT_1745356 [Mycena metata]|uniref:Uncharacterized protein n=1 Tax=Mycena metata TaxID=1033252 RepID=A0AAD7H3T3_9AGAR|nr:hypothetical protein B0H16DRAFT_1745356 [Mycena metata]